MFLLNFLINVFILNLLIENVNSSSKVQNIDDFVVKSNFSNQNKKFIKILMRIIYKYHQFCWNLSRVIKVTFFVETLNKICKILKKNRVAW